jgi:CheY-like chemotaxis protein
MYATLSESPARKPSKRDIPVVLIVDDQADVRLGYQLLLEAEGFEVLNAPDPRAALAILRDHAVSVVLLDLVLPGHGDGLNLIQTIRKMPQPQPAIIAMSGAHHLAFRSNLAAAQAAGADASIAKPMSRRALLDILKSVLERSE